MVMALGVVQQYEEAGSQHLDPRLFWEHSTACGLIASAIAKARQAKNPDEYLLWGMLHDVGRLILSEHVPDAYTQACNAAEQFDLPLEAVEARLMLLNHCDILERALENWHFPRNFITPVVNHHRSVASLRRLGPQHAEAAAVVGLADRLAHALLLGNSGNDTIYPIDELAEFLSLTPPMFAEIAAAVVDETRNLKLSMLARAHETDWPDFTTQTKERIGVPLRPLHLGPDSDADAVGVFVDRVAGVVSETAHNIAIVSLRKVDEMSQVIARLEAEEKRLAVSRLPLLVIASDPAPKLDKVLLQPRLTDTLSTPFSVTTFVRRVSKLLENPAALVK